MSWFKLISQYPRPSVVFSGSKLVCRERSSFRGGARAGVADRVVVGVRGAGVGLLYGHWPLCREVASGVRMISAKRPGVSSAG